MLPARTRRASPIALPISAEQVFTAQDGNFAQTPKRTSGQMHVLTVLGAHIAAAKWQPSLALRSHHVRELQKYSRAYCDYQARPVGLDHEHTSGMLYDNAGMSTCRPVMRCRR